MVEPGIYDGCGLIQFDSLDNKRELMSFRINEINDLECCIMPFDFKKYIDCKSNDK